MSKSQAHELDCIDSSDTDSDLIQVVTQLRDELSNLRDEVGDLEDTVESQQQRIESLEADLSEERNRRGREDAQTRQDVAQLRETVEEGGSARSNPTPETVQTDSPEPQTGLEDVVQLPETIVEDSLTANERRARFVAKDVEQYTRAVPAGRVIKSSEIRRVLSAYEDTAVHTQTVSRVLDFLDRLGEGDITVRERNGERLVCFSEDLVRRLESHSVVTEDSSRDHATP